MTNRKQTAIWKKQLLIIVTVTLLAAAAALFCCCRIVSDPQYPETKRAVSIAAEDNTAAKLLAAAFSENETVNEPEPVRAMNAAAEETVTLDNQPVSPESSAADQPETELIDVQYDTFRGKLIRVKDPSRVFVGVSGPFGTGYAGKQVADMAAKYGAVGGINASGFEDPNGTGSGGTPLGLVISQGNLLWGGLYGTYEVIGFDRNNQLCCGYMTGQQALDRGIRDAVCFGPVLLRDGQPQNTANSHGGYNPRSAIGQTADGTVLILAVEGRQISSIGATYDDLKQVLLDYGAVNAANLDGGASTVMVYEGEQQVICSSLYGSRNIPTCWLVAPES